MSGILYSPSAGGPAEQLVIPVEVVTQLEGPLPIPETVVLPPLELPEQFTEPAVFAAQVAPSEGWMSLAPPAEFCTVTEVLPLEFRLLFRASLFVFRLRILVMPTVAKASIAITTSEIVINGIFFRVIFFNLFIFLFPNFHFESELNSSLIILITNYRYVSRDYTQ
jgi:hypothetical protein